MAPNINPYIGDPVSEVPTVEPDEHCNGKTFDAEQKFEGYCDNDAGEGTDHPGEGRCAKHGGNSTGPKTEAGKLRSKSNGTKHGLTADPYAYHKTLDDPEQERFVIEAAAAIEDRIRENTGEVDFLDEIMARRVAVMIHIASRASEHVAEEDIFERIFTADGQIEVSNRMLEEIRQYNKDIARILDDIGATKESGAKMDALEAWRSNLS